jgi:hypothetical protein
MTRSIGKRVSIAVVGLVAGVTLTALGSAAQAPTIQGTWRSGDTTIRVTVNKTEVRGVFADVGQAARTLGFKPGDVSFTATVVDNYLHGIQIIRYRPTCHPTGRKVTMMARITPDRRTMAIHNYAVRVDDACRDTGEFSLSETLWQRVQ